MILSQKYDMMPLHYNLWIIFVAICYYDKIKNKNYHDLFMKLLE